MNIAKLIAMVACVALTACANIPASPPKARLGPLHIARQGSFFVGGRDIRSDNLSTIWAYRPSGVVTVDQLYVRYQIPERRRHDLNIVLIHGCCLTGKTWETTPDGRPGWDEFFLRRGYGAYVVDQAWRGRSAMDISAVNAVRRQANAPETLPQVVAASRESAWTIFRFGPEYGRTYPGMRFPIEAEAEFWKQMTPNWIMPFAGRDPNVTALADLSLKVGNTVLVSHSQSGRMPFDAARLRPQTVAAIVAVEPSQCPDRADDLSHLTRVPVLVLFGDYVDQSPRWAPRLQACRRFVAALNGIGGAAQLVELPAIGVRGNSHMMMQDRNSDQVAGLVAEWLDRHAVRPRRAGRR